MAAHESGESPLRRPILAAILLMTLALGARDITDPGSGLLGGDMARYLMNGAFTRDLIADGAIWDPGDIPAYAERYYAKYPALSLGHHPPVTYFALVPFYWIFGISVLAGRIAALAWFLLATWALYGVARRFFGWIAASAAALLFITNEFTLRFGQYVLSEMPMLACILLAVWFLLRFTDTRQRRDIVGFVVAVSASLYTKQLAIAMLPVYAIILAQRGGWRELATRRLTVTAAVGLVVLVPLAVISLGLAPGNVTMVRENLAALFGAGEGPRLGSLLRDILSAHLTLPAMVVVAAGALVLIGGRDKRAVVGGAWVLCAIAGSILAGGQKEPARYAAAAVPGYLLLASGLFVAKGPLVRAAGALAIAAALGWQIWSVRSLTPLGAGGYDEAAAYVIANSREPGVLYDSDADTGYFMFHLRAQDPARRFFVLRADKLLVADRGDFFPSLTTYGVHLVVVEERRGGPSALLRMHEALRGERFVERMRVPIRSRDARVQGASLIVYEFKDSRPADPDTELHIGVPLANRDIKLRIRDLVGR